MANLNLPNGFKMYGRQYHIGIYIAQGTIYPGDAVKFHTGDSDTAQANGANYRASVVVGTAAAALCGVALNYATAGQVVRVADDPNQLFLVMADAADVDTNGDIGLNAPIVATAGDATFKASRQALDSSDIDTTATDELKILGVLPRQDGKNELGAYVTCIVKINNHQLSAGTGSAGV